MNAPEVLSAARLDLGDVLRSRWLHFCAGIYALLAAVFVLVGVRESALMGFTGMGRVLLSCSHALVVVLPLLALVATGQVINQARENGALELLFSHPFSRTGYFVGVTATRLGVLALPLVALLAFAAVAGRLAFHQAVPWAFVLRSMLLGLALIWAFVGLGMWLSAAVRNPGKAMIAVLLTWTAAVALLDFGLISLMLQWRIAPRVVFALAALNPVQSARLGLLAGAEPDLATLGPVGFYLATRLGSSALYGVGLLWPMLFGAGAWFAGLRRFCRGDLV